jgi:hypothetical protein
VLTLEPKPKGYLKALVLCGVADGQRATLRVPTKVDKLECPLCLAQVKILGSERTHQVLIGSW